MKARAKDPLGQLLRPGNCLRIYFNPDNINNRTIEIREIVDDEMVVFRAKSKKAGNVWNYYIERRTYFQVLFKLNFLEAI